MALSCGRTQVAADLTAAAELVQAGGPALGEPAPLPEVHHPFASCLPVYDLGPRHWDNVAMRTLRPFLQFLRHYSSVYSTVATSNLGLNRRRMQKNRPVGITHQAP